ncbi:unnamed protein product [Vicia faba]|uniref:Mechanosensitive ion channel protein n=1 Tax=Vicia faba TaxID=3906 RepID=A0AAV0ZW44_VICFA|nr:unnamed protein product [Vicia faba]
MQSIKKSLKSLASYNKKSSRNLPDSDDREHIPILLPQQRRRSEDFSMAGDVVVKIDDGGEPENKIWRESSYDFWNDTGDNGEESFDFRNKGQQQQPEDPPSQLIGKFLHKQKVSGEMSLDMDLEMEELQNEEDRDRDGKLTPVEESPTVIQRELKVSFEEPASAFSNAVETPASAPTPAPAPAPAFNNVIEATNDPVRRRHSKDSPSMGDSSRPPFPPHHDPRRSRSPADGGDGEVLTCTSNASFERNLSMQRKSALLKTKTKSRLMDPPDEQPDRRSGRVAKSGQLLSGFLGKKGDDEEDDPFLEEDFPDEYKKTQFSFWILLEWLSLILIIGALITTMSVPLLRDKNLWELKLWKWEVMILILICESSKRDKSTYFDRIQESLFNQFVIETLSGPPLVEIRRAEEEEERLADEVQKLQNAGANIPADLRATAFPSNRSGRLRSGLLQKSPLKSGKFSMPLSKKSDDGGIGNGGGITIDHLHKLNPNNVSAWNMKRLMNMVRHGVLTTLDEQILDSTPDDEHATQIRSENEAKAAAKKIFQNVARRGCRFIYPEDLIRFMREDETVKTLNLFEGASDSGKISKSALKNWVVNAFRERRALALTLNDTKTAVNKLHRMLNFLVAIVILVIWLLILEIATTKFLLFVSSQLVLVAFIFGNTCKTVFEAIIFLFVMHPFDVGDRCEIDTVQMVVEEMNILTTVFLRYDNLKITIPNSVLATKAIQNFYRSPDMGDAIEFCIHVATPLEKISLMKHRIHSYVDNKKEHWYPSPFIVLKDHDQLNMVKVAIWPTHRMNFQDMGERFIRRSILIEELMKIFRDLDIQYRLMPLDINVRAMPTSSDRVPASWSTFTN